MKRIVCNHLNRYPNMQIQDVVKLLFQSEFGPGHLISDQIRTEQWLKAELIETKEDEPEIVPVSEELVRLHLGKMDERHVQMILEGMIQTANQVHGSMDSFIQKIELIKQMNLFSMDELENYVQEYLKQDSLVVSHTEVYRSLYHPHYRVLKKEIAEKIMNELHR